MFPNANVGGLKAIYSWVSQTVSKNMFFKFVVLVVLLVVHACPSTNPVDYVH